MVNFGGKRARPILNIQPCADASLPPLNLKQSSQTPSALAQTMKDRVFQDASVNIQKFEAVRGMIDQLLIEGPEIDLANDFSYSLVDQCELIKRLERGIPLDAYMLLTSEPATVPSATLLGERGR